MSKQILKQTHLGSRRTATVSPCMARLMAAAPSTHTCRSSESTALPTCTVASEGPRRLMWITPWRTTDVGLIREPVVLMMRQTPSAGGEWPREMAEEQVQVYIKWLLRSTEMASSSASYRLCQARIC